MSDIHLNRAGQNLGIFSESEVQTGLDSGRFLGSDLAWRTGMDNWKPLSQWAELTVPATPPLPVLPGSGGPPPFLETRGDLPSWERKAELGFLTAFASTIKEILTEPAATFARMKENGGFFTPFLYLLISSGLAMVLTVGVQLALRGSMGSAMATRNADLNRMLMAQGIGVTASALGFLLIFPILLFIYSFIGSGLWHLSLMVLGGAKKPFEATYRVYSYASGSTALLGLVPCCGSVIAAVWKIVAGSIGLSKVHEISTGKAVLAILLPLLLCCGLCLAGFIPLYHSLVANPDFTRALKDFQ